MRDRAADLTAVHHLPRKVGPMSVHISWLSSAATDHNGQVGLPAVVEQLLADVAADGFTVYCCGPKAAPQALVACYEWADYVDLLTVCDFDRVTTARVPRRDRLDIFAPEIVVWAYEGAAQHAVRALLDLVHPAHPDAPVTGYSAPASLHIPQAWQRPMTIRPPCPGRVGVRAARLAAAMGRPPGGDCGGPVGTSDPRLAAGWVRDPRRWAPGGQPAFAQLHERAAAPCPLTHRKRWGTGGAMLRAPALLGGADRGVPGGRGVVFPVAPARRGRRPGPRGAVCAFRWRKSADQRGPCTGPRAR